KMKTQKTYCSFQMSAYSFENKKLIPVRFLSFHFAYGKMKTAILELLQFRIAAQSVAILNYLLGNLSKYGFDKEALSFEIQYIHNW
ncbi:MAG: hypothetical protein ACKPCM_11510, partial [Pseudanabaena sp.]